MSVGGGWKTKWLTLITNTYHGMGMWWELWIYSVLYTQNYMLYLMHDLSQELVNIFLKGQIVKILVFAGHMI